MALSRRVATIELRSFRRRYATRLILATLSPALKDRAKLTPPLRGDMLKYSTAACRFVG